MTILAATITLLLGPATTDVPTGPTSPVPACADADITCLIQRTWPAAEWAHVEHVVQCESHGHPDAVGRNGTSRVLGLLQLDEWSWARKLTAAGFDWTRWADPFTNLRMGRWIFDRTGWTGWACASRAWTR